MTPRFRSPKSGHTSKANQPQKKLIFRCEYFGYELDAALAGSRNIALRTLLFRQNLTSTGILSALPNVSNSDSRAKAETLLRFSGVRCSRVQTQAPTVQPYSACGGG
ncbi:hypothetical protein IQ270_04055 [Microcoleus sp. LEGE 07076]|uniref:hypothetical protein n=1 Tax=Microcoleus sp. LEGE 07076 TaxID=915322 RepID=UPI001881C1EA|nr:hypothetical protein [Microcoleus sp. LEGE 07076]MBE9183918.1 hypothetical protein [Microcoleus sp. LEGE 07076]